MRVDVGQARHFSRSSRTKPGHDGDCRGPLIADRFNVGLGIRKELDNQRLVLPIA